MSRPGSPTPALLRDRGDVPRGHGAVPARWSTRTRTTSKASRALDRAGARGAGLRHRRASTPRARLRARPRRSGGPRPQGDASTIRAARPRRRGGDGASGDRRGPGIVAGPDGADRRPAERRTTPRRGARPDRRRAGATPRTTRGCIWSASPRSRGSGDTRRRRRRARADGRALPRERRRARRRWSSGTCASGDTDGAEAVLRDAAARDPASREPALTVVQFLLETHGARRRPRPSSTG